jgi:hypothetical protein
MTDVTTTAPLDEVRGLVDERARYEGWLAALDARRAVTPAHVLERVRVDYEGRLRRVSEALDGHVPALRADEAAVSGHHDDRLRLLGERRDTLAEVELRTLVGEFPPDEGERQRREVEGEISALESVLASAAARLADLRGLLGRVTPEAAPAPPAQSEAATPPFGTPAAPGAPAAFGGTSAAAGGDAGASGAHGDPLGLDAARAALGDTDVHGYVPGHYAPAMRGGEARATPPFAGQSFADAAIGVPVGGGQGTASAGGSVTQEKTLRCPDCGAMNYPTEWYCEKCGGELAAL